MQSSTTTLRLGLSTGALWPEHSTLQAPEIAARLGVGEIEVMLQAPEEYEPTFARQLRRIVDDAGLRVHSVHVKHGLHPLFAAEPERVVAGRALFDRAIAAAATLGAGVIVWHGADRHDLARDEAETRTRFIETTGELAAACGAAGVTLAIENVSWCILATVRAVQSFATRLPEIAPREHLGFVFDPFHAAEADANAFMMLAAMGDRIVDVHLSDYRPSSVRHLPPGEGDIPWPAVLRAIASGYAGPMMVESPLGPDPAPAFAAIRAHIEPLIPRRTADGAEPVELPPGVVEGIALFNAGAFYECHEVIEHEWHAERGTIRRLYQGILQIGVGFHHARNGNQRGAVLLLTDGIAKVREFTPDRLGIDTGRLADESQVCLDQIIALGPDGIEAPLIGTVGTVGT